MTWTSLVVAAAAVALFCLLWWLYSLKQRPSSMQSTTIARQGRSDPPDDPGCIPEHIEDELKTLPFSRAPPGPPSPEVCSAAHGAP